MDIKTIVDILKLSPELEPLIHDFLLNVSSYKLIPYINMIKDNDELYTSIKKQVNIKNKWEAIVYLYRYNIKLSIALYPYIYLLETILKTRINNKLTVKYTDYWFRDELLLIKANKINNINDLSLYNKYKDKEMTKEIEAELLNDFALINDQLHGLNEEIISPTKIKTKVKHVKRCCFLYQEKQKALLENPRISCIEFAENKVTLGYWLSILGITDFWENETKFIDIFPNLCTNLSKKTLLAKLENIRILRNKIAHHSQIIGINQIKKGLSLFDIYKDIEQLFECLNVNFNADFNIMELKCNMHEDCNKRSFLILYKELEQIHDKEIIAQKILRNTLIKTTNIQSSYFKKIGYDPSERIFQVEFNGGEIYQYFNVPIILNEKFLLATSKGKFFIKHIRESFKFQKMN
jgi:hypothetical protein